MSPAVEVQSPNHWTTRESPSLFLSKTALGEEGLAGEVQGVLLMSLQAQGPDVLVTEMGFRPHLMDVLPERGLYLHVCPIKCTFFSGTNSQRWCPGEGSIERGHRLPR